MTDTSAAAHPHSRSCDPYLGCPPWEIGAPQPAMLALAENGELHGRVLDVGCGTGEHTLIAAASGLDATGIDTSARALRTAEEKARERGLTARFVRHDALRLAELGETFDTALDSLFLHGLTAADRAVYVDGLHTVVRPGGRLFVLCYSDRHTGEPDVPHKLSRDELESCFTDGWVVESVEATVCRSNVHAGGIAAWLATCRRT
ncbi:class I SAM-dependent methyltransferase [Actinomadura formosensis]|uniref:class I SAM-dependent methyltransferase n=1 Tax=Actinomadura formosensis TaxID=60706 RepID=UPI000831D435|nr:class I SAM-dependent methyltransferase [Actinomadura formosensis]